MSPYRSDQQRKWAHTKSGVEALGKAGVKEWDKKSKGKKLPKRVKKKKMKKAIAPDQVEGTYHPDVRAQIRKYLAQPNSNFSRQMNAQAERNQMINPAFGQSPTGRNLEKLESKQNEHAFHDEMGMDERLLKDQNREAKFPMRPPTYGDGAAFVKPPEFKEKEMVDDRRNAIVKALVFEFIEDARANGYELEPEDTAPLASFVIDTLDTVRKAANVPDNQLTDFIERFDKDIRANALNKLDSWYEDQMLQKSVNELTYHPEHTRAHETEDENGQMWHEGMIKKGRIYDLPVELREHLDKYHGFNKVFHCHVEGTDPLIFGKSATYHRNNGGVLERGYLHEVIHRLDEKAYREQMTGQYEEATDEQIATYDDFNKGTIYAGMVWADGVITTPELAEHLNLFHGMGHQGKLKYQPHPVEIPMIGPSGVHVQMQALKKAAPVVENPVHESNAVDELKALFEQGKKKRLIKAPLGAASEDEESARQGYQYEEPQIPQAEPDTMLAPQRVSESPLEPDIEPDDYDYSQEDIGPSDYNPEDESQYNDVIGKLSPVMGDWLSSKMSKLGVNRLMQLSGKGIKDLTSNFVHDVQNATHISSANAAKLTSAFRDSMHHGRLREFASLSGNPALEQMYENEDPQLILLHNMAFPETTIRPNLFNAQGESKQSEPIQ
jgi:hypothetical protein